MLRMALAPCAPFNVTTELMVKAARLARQYPGVRLHTHLAENQEDIDFSQKEYGCRPGAYIKSALPTAAPHQQTLDTYDVAHAQPAINIVTPLLQLMDAVHSPATSAYSQGRPCTL